MNKNRVVGIIMVWVLIGVYVASFVLREWGIDWAAIFAAGWFIGGGLAIFLNERLRRSTTQEGHDER